MSKRSLGAFEAVYCSGLFIPDAALVTAMAILFDRVHLPNHIRFLNEFPRHFRLSTPPLGKLKVTNVTLQRDEGAVEEDPLQTFSGAQRNTFVNYLFFARDFHQRYESLFGPVFQGGVEVNVGDPVMEDEAPSEKPGNRRFTVDVPIKVDAVDEDPQSYVDQLVSLGVVPVLGAHHIPVAVPSSSTRLARSVAAIVALDAARLVIPATTGADGDTILEARHQLRDQLPPFWAAMLAVSESVRDMVAAGAPKSDVDHAIADLVDVRIYPALVNLKQKLSRDRRRWFSRILATGRDSMTIALGRPELATSDLVSAGLVLGTNVALDIAQELNAESATKLASPLTFLLRLHEKLS